MQPANQIQLSVATPDGEFVAHYSTKGLAGLNFPSARGGRAKLADQRATALVRRWHRTTTAALEQALAGKPPKSLPPLDLSAGTPFQQCVWRALGRIKAGQTRSYGDIAKTIGRPRSVRAVGGACGANPIPVFIPCHRVLAANRKLGGFSGGLDWKRKLLAREGVQAEG